MLTRRTFLGVAIEGSPGVAETLDAADAALVVYDLEMQPAVEFQQRPAPGGMSDLAGVPGARGGTCTFRTDVYGSGVAATVPLWASRLLPACGFQLVETSGDDPRFTPDCRPPDAAETGTHTVTLGQWQDGKLKMLRGCQGSFKFTGPSGKLAQIEWTFTGIWVAPIDQAMPAPTLPTVTPLRFASASLSAGGSTWAPRVSELTLDAGMEVKLREDANDDSGYYCATITNRRIVGTMDPEASLVAEDDPHAAWLAMTEQALEFQLGSAAGNMILVAAPAMQWTNPQNGDREGLAVDALEFQLNGVVVGGDDELEIVFP